MPRHDGGARRARAAGNKCLLRIDGPFLLHAGNIPALQFSRGHSLESNMRASDLVSNLSSELGSTMGFLDNLQSYTQRASEIAGSVTRQTALRGKIADTQSKRREYAAQLGEKLYELTKDDPSLRSGQEDLYDAIAACDAQCEDYEKELASIEAEAAKQHTAFKAWAAQSGKDWICPKCGETVSGDDRYCMNCGYSLPLAPVAAQAAPEPETVVCPKCGEANARGAKFCMNCGAPLGQ